MGLVDQQAAVLRGVERVAPPVERLRRPELGRVILRRLVLHHARGIGRDAVFPAVVAVDMELVERPVAEPVAVHRLREEGAPYAVRVALHTYLGTLPVVEIAEDVDVVRARQPFAQPPSVEQLVPLPAEITVAVGVVDDRACRLLDRVYFVRIPFVAAVELLLGGEQPLVAFYDREPAGRFFHSGFPFIQIYEFFFYLCPRLKNSTLLKKITKTKINL